MPYKHKPVPTDMREWVVEVTGIARFLTRIDTYRPGKGEPWIAKQKQYYDDRIRILLNTPPTLPSKPKWRRMLECK